MPAALCLDPALHPPRLRRELVAVEPLWNLVAESGTEVALVDHAVLQSVLRPCHHDLLLLLRVQRCLRTEHLSDVLLSAA